MLDQVMNEFDWFSDICENAIDKQEQFSSYHALSKDKNRVQFTDGEYIIEFNYWPEDYPHIVLQTVIGVLHGSELVGLWLVLSKLNIEDDIEKHFSNRSELSDILDKLFQNVLAKYYSEIFNMQTIKNSYSTMISDMSTEYEAEKLEKLRTQIISEFKNGNYRSVVQLVDSNNQLHSDKRIIKMYEYSAAKNHIGS